MSPSRLTHDPLDRWIPRRAASRRSLLALLALSLAVSSCGKESKQTSEPIVGPGVPSTYIAAPMHAIDFGRFVLTVLADSWDSGGGLDRSWHYDAGTGDWTKTDSTVQTVYVGGEVTTQIRTENVVTLVATFSKAGLPHSDLMTADRVHLLVTIQQRRYSLNPAYPLTENYDLFAHLATEFSLAEGSADTIVAAGSVSGWWLDLVRSDGQRIRYAGHAQVVLDFPEHYVRCPGESMSASIAVTRDDGVQLDLFFGSFHADPGDGRFTGALESEWGTARFVIDEGRSCP
jgi:hypothetical protein